LLVAPKKVQHWELNPEPQHIKNITLTDYLMHHMSFKNFPKLCHMNNSLLLLQHLNLLIEKGCFFCDHPMCIPFPVSVVHAHAPLGPLLPSLLTGSDHWLQTTTSSQHGSTHQPLHTTAQATVMTKATTTSPSTFINPVMLNLSLSVLHYH
jgi:hypothetical protein